MSYSSWQPLRIDLQAIIKNFIEAYPYDPFEIMVIESVANSLDAKASRILLTLEDRQGDLYYSISDNGGGMTKEEFEANYHALAISSKTKGAGIGFAGIGAKLYLVFLPAGKTILTETRKNGSSLASYLTLVDGEPRWTYSSPSKLSQDGTYYELMINPDHKQDASEKTLIDIIQRHFNSILLGISSRKCEIIVNGKKVEAWKPDIAAEHKFEVKIGNQTYRGILWHSKKDMKRIPGFEISVFGKTIQTDWFGLDYSVKSQVRTKISGHVVADALTALLNTTKTAFKPSLNPFLSASFRKEVFTIARNWLKSIDALEEKKHGTRTTHEIALQSEIQKILAQSLQMPDLIKYNPFMDMRRAKVTIKSQKGEIATSLIQGGQETAGNIGGERGGEGVTVPGPSSGKSPAESPKGKEKGEHVERRVKTGIRINYVYEPGNPKETWIIPEAIVINKGHPVYTKSVSQGYSVEVMNTLRIVYMELIQNRPPDTVAEAMDDLREFFHKWSITTI